MVRPITDGFVPWSQEESERYRREGWWAGRSLGDELWDVAARRSEHPALVDGDLRLTYAELTARAEAAAGRLLGLGLVPGDRLLVQLPNTWHFVVLSLACLRSGVVPIMALPAHRELELAHLAQLSEARGIAVPSLWRGFDHHGLARKLADSLPDLEHVLVAGGARDGSVDLDELCAAPEVPAPEPASPGGGEIALFLLSGGTTGLPKLISRTHQDYAYNARCSAAASGMSGDTVYLAALPASHNFALACPGVIGTLLCGGTVVMLASPEPSGAFAAIAREHVTHTAVVPAVAQRWMEHREQGADGDLSSLEVLQVGGARIADELAQRVSPLLGCTLQQVFGMAEGLINMTRLDDPPDVICSTQGRPMSPGDEVRLVEVDGRAVGPDQAGLLLTRGPYTPRGYYRADEQNARAFTADGWYRSGDVCRMTPEGNLVVEGRDKDLINRGGEKVSAEAVENLAYQVADVREAAAVAMPDPVLGERVCLFAVLRPHATLDLPSLRARMTEAGVAAYMLPERLELCDELPKTKVGKLDKKALRERAALLAAPGELSLR